MASLIKYAYCFGNCSGSGIDVNMEFIFSMKDLSSSSLLDVDTFGFLFLVLMLSCLAFDAESHQEVSWLKVLDLYYLNLELAHFLPFAIT